MGLLQFALGLSKTKCESPKVFLSTKPRENPGFNEYTHHIHCLQDLGNLYDSLHDHG